jgi:phosphopantetheinyl transferase
VGIDLERVSAVHDPDGVLRVAFSAAETALLAGGCPLDARHVAIAWSAKEAVAKSLGQKMLGREQSFVMTAFDPHNATIRIAHDGNAVDAFYAVEGDFVCTLAAPAAP